MTTETSLTLINPDGTATTTDNAHPVRTKRDTGWADLDATLHKNADGTLSPAVSSLSVTLSGGGDGPMAAVTTADGKKLAVTAPFALPAPTLDGTSATYTNVLPDVDLKVSVLPTGGWRDVLVVKTPQAAADARLKNLHFPISADGLNVTTDAAGNISLKDASGKTRLHAPTPLQWDSTPPAPQAPIAPGAKTAKTTSLFAAPAASTGPQADTSTTEGPGNGARESRITVKADNQGFDLTPDPAVLGKGTGPWYLDPSISADSWSANSAQVQEYHPDTTYYNAVTDLGTGYCGYSDCTGNGRERAYFSINVNAAIYTQPSGAPSAPTVYNSTLYANADGASSPSTNTPLGLYLTGVIGSGVTWNTQPCNGGGTFGGCSKIGNSFWITGTGPISFDVSSQMQQAAAGKWGTITVGIAPDDENNMYYRHHIANNPHITTNYDLQPSIWWPHTTPQPGFANTNQHNDCQTPVPAGQTQYAWYNPGWVGANQNITLTSSSWSPANLNLHTTFRIWDDNQAGWGMTPDTGWTGSWNPNGVSVNVGSLTDGHQYGWVANASDGGLTSPDTAWCYFRVDKTPPVVSVSSAQFPPSGSPAPSPLTYANQPGTFTISGYDPAPTGGSASGVACFKVSTSSTPVTGWNCTDGATTGVLLPDANGQANYTYTPGTWGINTLYVQVQDNAGNYSQPYTYNFYAPWNPASTPVFGDVTGDGKPDIVLSDGNGALRVVQNTSDPVNAGWLAGAATSAPPASPTGNWNGVQVTHRSSLRGPVAVDDLIVHAPGDPLMYLYYNDGHGNFYNRTSFYLNGTVTKGPIACLDVDGTTAITCPGELATQDWSTTTQILALGTPDGENAAGPNGTTVLTKTSLLAVIGGHLWLFPPGAKNAQLLRKTTDELSVKPWTDANGNPLYDLIAPGPANGPTSYTTTVSGTTTTVTVKQATLWVRQRSTGNIIALPITKNADGSNNYSALSDPTVGTVIRTGVDYATYPLVGSVGDLTGDGVPDLYAQTAAGNIAVWPGVIGDATNHPGVVSSLAAPNNIGDPRGPVGRYPLAGPVSTTDTTHTPDLTGHNTGTLGGDVTFGSTTIGGTATNAATLNMNASATTKGEIDSGLQVDTTKSFTISTWARLDQTGNGVVVSQDGHQGSNFLLWAGAQPDGTVGWRFAMANTDSASAWSTGYDLTDTTTPAARVQIGAWTKLTASYNAATGQMALYVNGALAATGSHKTPFAPTGSLVIGRYQDTGQGGAWFHGAIADVTAYPYATTAP